LIIKIVPQVNHSTEKKNVTGTNNIFAFLVSENDPLCDQSFELKGFKRNSRGSGPHFYM